MDFNNFNFGTENITSENATNTPDERIENETFSLENVLTNLKNKKEINSKSIILVDMDKDDHSTFFHIIQALYKQGYSKFKLIHTKKTIIEKRKNIEHNIENSIKETVKRFHMMSVSKISDNETLLKIMNSSNKNDVSEYVQKIVLMFQNISKELLLKPNQNKEKLNKIRDKITELEKYISYVKRIITMQPATICSGSNRCNEYICFFTHTLNTLDCLCNILRSIRRDMYEFQEDFVYDLLNKYYQMIEIFRKTFENKNSIDNLNYFIEFSKLRGNATLELKKYMYKLNEKDILVIGKISGIIEQLLFLMEERIVNP